MSDGKTSLIRKRRAELFQQQNGLCHWCREAMIPPVPYYDGRVPDGACTFDHLYANNDPRRKSLNDLDNAVAACRRCNHDRSVEQSRSFNGGYIGPQYVFAAPPEPRFGEGPFAKLKALLEAAE